MSNGKEVVVGMSGGSRFIRNSISIKEQGYDVIGVFSEKLGRGRMIKGMCRRRLCG